MPVAAERARRGARRFPRALPTVVALVALVALVAWIAGALACAVDEPLQGEAFLPDRDPVMGTVSERVDGSPDGCIGTRCDGGIVDAGPPPGKDGSAQPTNMCETARDIGTISGDTDTERITATGACSEWVRVRVTEDSAGAIGAPMKVKITLAPNAHDFDVYAYVDPDRDQVACATPFARGETLGLGAEEFSFSWGEGNVANGSDDVRTVRVLVLGADGPCPPGAGWTLSVQGNR